MSSMWALGGRALREAWRTPEALKAALRERLGRDDVTLDDVFLDATGRSRERSAGDVREVRA